MARYMYLLLAFLLVSSVAIGQTVQGKILDQETGEGLPFANVVLEKDGVQKAGTTTTLDGNYVLTGFDPGSYDLRVVYVGYQDKLITSIVVSPSKTVPLDVKMTSGAGVKLDEIIVEGYRVPLIEADNTASGSTVTAEEIAKLPTKNVTSVIATTAGVSRAKEGEETSFRGAREGDDIIYVDGVRTRRSTVPAADIEQIQIITGGLPAEYGDVTGGVTNIITKGPSGKFSGNAEVETSQFLDAYGYNFGNLSLSGPLWKKKTDEDERTIIGYRISGQYRNQKDGNPSYVGGYKATDEFLDQVKSDPLVPALAGFLPRGEFITADDINYTKYRPNVNSQDYNITGKVDFGLTEDVNVTAGGNYNWIKNKSISRARWLMSPESQRDRFETDWRVYVRLRHKIGATASLNETDEEKEARTSATVQNIHYLIQGDYNNYERIIQAPDHKENLWNYGHIGSFQKEFVPQFNDTIMIDGVIYPETSEYLPVTTAFTPGTANPYLADWVRYKELNDDENANGLLLTQRNLVGLHANLGSVANRYETLNRTQYSLSASAGFDIIGKGAERSKHSFKFGIIYEQRIDRSYSIDPFELWVVGNQLVSSTQFFDKSNPVVENDTVRYLQGYGAGSVFTENLKDLLGTQSGQFINLEAIRPEDLNIGMFGADEIIGVNGLRMRYHGYDYAGNKVDGSTSFNDFFTERDSDGNLTRPVAAEQPIYTAFYLQDKFTFKDLYFNIGLRIDRFDANTKVLKDEYSLARIKTAGEATDIIHAPGVQDDWVVYVESLGSDVPFAYREGDQWYDKTGDAVNDPTAIFGTRPSIPLLVDGRTPRSIDFDPNEVFTDYTPQINIMPRISFSFPINDDAGFFAHYDILTRRPTEQNSFSALDYYYFQERLNVGEIQNPNLKPSKTIDYQIGFQQKVSNSSAVTLTAFYREQRDMVARRTVGYAYPTVYSSFGNRDFGTVKGFTFEYDMRRTKNLRLRFNYTLQFAEGTGSSGTTSLRGTASVGDVRPILPFNFDQRHNLIATIDYRYGQGKKYTGPRLFGKNTLENFGINLLVNVGSGRPYSRKSQVEQYGGRNTEGVFNGSRLPWTSRIDLRVDKDFTLGKKDASKSLDLNVFVTFQNLLDTENVVDVYPFSQSPSDDGYLESVPGQTTLEDNESSPGYRELYDLLLLNQSFYGLPRRIRLGVVLTF